jgi:uncharacterized protein YndB with AHSA1/START domain
MSITIEVCTEINAPPAIVWDAVEHIESHVEWMKDAVSVTFRGSAHRGVGAEFDCLTRVGPLRTRDHFVVTKWQPGECMGIEHRGAVTGSAEFRLQPGRSAGTHFCWEERLRFPWFLGGVAGEQIGKPILARIWRGNLDRLKAKIESS